MSRTLAVTLLIELSPAAHGALSRVALPAKQSGFAPQYLLIRVPENLFLYRLDDVRAFLPKSLEVEVLDKLTQRHLPWLLIVIVQLTQLLGI